MRRSTYEKEKRCNNTKTVTLKKSQVKNKSKMLHHLLKSQSQQIKSHHQFNNFQVVHQVVVKLFS